MGKLKIVVVAVVIAFLSKCLYGVFKDGDLSTVAKEEEFWGPEELQSVKEDVNIYPFKVQVDDKMLDSLKLQLALELDSGRLKRPLEGMGFQYGFNTDYLQKVLTYWQSEYDWRRRESLLNKYPHFKTRIAGIDIHFQHVKSVNGSKYKTTKPLLLLHGWPGTFVEFQKIIPLLTDPNQSDFNFELIIPSLPGYGFSQGAVRPGLGTIAASRIFAKLMKRLHFDKFYVQGGDWGSVISMNLATLYPENVLAMHSNLCMSMHPRTILRTLFSSLFPSLVLTQEEITRFMPLSEYFKFMLRESGYGHIQATKPDTIGIGLSLSPSGLAAYILEKFSTWTNLAGVDAEDGNLTNHFTMNELLDNVMIYWVTNSMTTAMRFYAESVRVNDCFGVMSRIPVQVPVGCITSLDPFDNQGKWILQDKLPNIVHYEINSKGGHFLSMEHPKILADDLFRFVNILGSQ